MKPVYVCDLDGTLLGPEPSLSPRSREGLLRLIERDVPIGVATARSVESVRPLLPDVPIRLPVVEMNGAYVSDLATGEHLEIHAMEEVVAESLYREIHDLGLSAFFSTHAHDRDRFYYTDNLSEGARHYLGDRIQARDPRRTRTDDLSVALREQVVCVTVIDRPAVVDGLTERLAEALGDSVRAHVFDDMYHPGWKWFTAFSPDAAKEFALAKMLAREGLDDHELVVFGDTDADIGMFRMAHRAVAVENATENLKAHATHHIGHHAEDSVIEFILADAEL